jgi:hypothetical protein
MHPTRANTNKAKQAGKTARAHTREYETLGTKQHKLHDQIRVIRILMKILILHPRNFCSWVCVYYLSISILLWMNWPSNSHHAWGKDQCWEGIRKVVKTGQVSSWFSHWISQGITKGDAPFETRLEVLTGLKTAHLNPFH